MTMRRTTYAVVDVESTVYKKGHPYAARNKCCAIGVRIGGVNYCFDIEHGNGPYADKIARIRELIHSVDVIVLFNGKFDLGWLARYGIFLNSSQRIFDCQLAEFLLTHQQSTFPSLDDCSFKYLGRRKLDVVRRDYWDRGLDTTDVPWPILEEYLQSDLELTDELYQRLQALVESAGLEPLLRLHFQDLRVLSEMEFNGIRLDWAALEQQGKRTEAELKDVVEEIKTYVPHDARQFFNTGSTDHVSLLLYGGTLDTRVPVPYHHTYKSGRKAGTTEIRNRWEDIRIEFPRLVDPLPDTQLVKDGFFGTGANVLRELPRPKQLIKLLLKEAELSKLLTTYYHGFAAKREEMDWQDGCIHSQLNQCVVITGRLSSSNPNQQNMPEDMHEFIISRYA